VIKLCRELLGELRRVVNKLLAKRGRTHLTTMAAAGGGCQPEENVTGLRKGHHSSADIYSMFF
jgi:hypothetical protein